MDNKDIGPMWQTDDGANPSRYQYIPRCERSLEDSNFYGIDKFGKNSGDADRVNVAGGDTDALHDDVCSVETKNDRDTPQYNEKSLLQSIFAQNEEGDNCLHLCIIHKRKDDILKILKMNVNAAQLDMQNSYGQTALHLATITKQPEVVQTLLLAGASHLIQDDNGRTPLHIACEMGSLTIVKTLTRFNRIFLPYPSIDNFQGLDFVYTAAKHSHADIVQYLVDLCGHNINCTELCAGKTVLHLAVEKCQLSLLDLLLNHEQTDFTIEDYSGHRALGLARYHPESWNFIVQSKPELERVLTDMFDEDLSSDEEFLPEA